MQSGHTFLWFSYLTLPLLTADTFVCGQPKGIYGQLTLVFKSSRQVFWTSDIPLQGQLGGI